MAKSRGTAAAPTNLAPGQGKGGSSLYGPLFSEPVANSSLGAEPVGGPMGGKSIPDPVGLKHGLGDSKKGRK